MRWKRVLFSGLGIGLIYTLFIHAKTTPDLPVPLQDKPIRTIVIDAGHGGSDHGAGGRYSHEKDIALDVALKLGKILEDAMPDVKVVYTRKTDRFDDVHRKAAIANEAKGDLFISIHCNAAPPIKKIVGYKTRTYYVKKKKRTRRVNVYESHPNPAKGTETYIWATAKNAAKTESLRNNSVIVFDANSEETQAIMDAQDPETIIMLNTLRNVYFDQSVRLSTLVQDEFSRVGRIDRGARQRNEKGILVLHATAMPSVLVELGFISNPEEEEYLNSADGQNELATCIYRAVKRYKDELERVYKSGEAARPALDPAPAPASAPTVPARQVVNHIPATVSTTNETPDAPAADAENLNYKVQLMTTEKVYARTNTLFKNLKGTIEREEFKQGKKKVNKYIWGSFRTEAEAQAAVYKARKQGFSDAFMLTYKDGSRID
ncbi:N-acetylmuramoyl-L-alanine amidase family protein [Chitinophaga barathri]|uniref:N-acetylmuramoyl-L-alanine amidase n=1 Tax=Chitinophaga barathri TaxID=1647451 RepID=A0A3N4MHX8_9BACT|nr:N-acetylmuramoyl-L-alanine amidase [Chitinophaga barathri]RPD41656.1 N-acetylmuramoyl-L-alanine amidase [Chitinophaga barathri]